MTCLTLRKGGADTAERLGRHPDVGGDLPLGKPAGQLRPLGDERLVARRRVLGEQVMVASLAALGCFDRDKAKVYVQVI